MTALRKLILGETRILPAGIVALVAGAVILGEVAGHWWHDAGGFLILALTVALLGAAVPWGRR